MKLSIRFSLVPGKSSDLPIRIRVSYDGIRLDMRTGYVCPPDAWNEPMMRMIPGTTNRYKEKATIINAKLSEQEACIEKIITKYELENLVPDANLLKADFDRMMGRTPKNADPSTKVCELYERFMREQSKIKSWTTSTINSYNALRIRIDKKIGSKQISKIVQEDLQSIIDLLVSEGIKNTSIKRMTGYLNTFLAWCKDKDLYKGKMFSPTLKGTSSDNTINYLEWDEVLKIHELELFNRYDIITRDTFCFQCFTGLRTIDVLNLKWSQVFMGADIPHIIVTTIKTSDTVKIELNDYSMEILKRYEGDKGTRSTIFPPLGKEAKNRHLPRIARAAGVKGTISKTTFSGSARTDITIDRADAITTHWGRHSFIVHALSIGISPNVVMSWTGHSSYDAMRPYINIVDSVKAEAMKKFNKIQ